MPRYLLTAALFILSALLICGPPQAPAQERTRAEVQTRAETQATQLAQLRRRYARAIHALAETELATAIEENRLTPGSVSPTRIRRLAAVTEASRISAQMAELMTSPREVEKDVLRLTLDQKVSVDFRHGALRALIDGLAEKYHINVLFDDRALDDLGVDPDSITDVTVVLRSVSLRAILNFVLRKYDLTFLVNDEVLLITTIDEANNRLNTVIYDVYDLLAWEALEPGEPGSLDYDSLIELITSTVAPTTWDVVGGPGSIAGLYGALTVSQTQQVHEQIADLLLRLRKMRLSRSDVSGVVRVLEAGQ